MGIKKNFVFNVLLSISNIIFPVLTIPYVSRVLGIVEIGKFNFVITIASYFILVSTLGIPLYGIREIAKVTDDNKEKNKLFNEIFSINIVSSLICFFSFIILVFLIPDFYKLKELYLLASIGVVFSFLNLDWFFSGIENFKIIAIRSVVVKFLNVIALFVFVRDSSDLYIYICIYTLSTVLNQIWNFLSLRRENIVISLTLKGLRKHLEPLSILFFSAIAIQIYLMIDTVIIGFLLDYKQVGIYSSAIKSVRLMMPIITAFGVVILPRIASYGVEDKEMRDQLLDQSFEFINFLSIPITIFFILISPYFVPLFFGSGYEEVIIPMKFLSSLIFVGNISYFFSVQILAMLSKERLFLISVCLGMLINVSFNFLLIPKWGVIGASIASIFAELMLSIISAFFVFKFVMLRINFKPIFDALAASLPIMIASYLCDFDFYGSNMLAIIVIGLVYLISYLVIQFFVFKNRIILLILKKIRII